MIGTLGKKIIFEASAEKVLTFSKFERSTSGNWEEHARIGQKPRTEFIGAALQTSAIDIVLDAHLGIKPRETIDTIVEMIESGEAEDLVIGGKPIGKNKWAIKSMTDTWDTMLSGGELVKASLSLELAEYI